MAIEIYQRSRKVLFSRDAVRSFNRVWPCSELSNDRAYWFQFEANGDLVDTDVPEHSDGGAAAALADDAKALLFDGVVPTWHPHGGIGYRD